MGAKKIACVRLEAAIPISTRHACQIAQRSCAKPKYGRCNMGLILVIILILLVFGGGGGYYGYRRYGGSGLGGALLLALIIVFVLWYLGGVHLQR